MSQCEHCGRDEQEAREERHRANNEALIRELLAWIAQKKNPQADRTLIVSSDRVTPVISPDNVPAK